MSNPGVVSHDGTQPYPFQIRAGLGKMLQAVHMMMDANGQLQTAVSFRKDIQMNVDHPIRKLRRKMIAGNPGGEVGEYLDAEFSNDHEEIMDGGIDTLIVVFGMLLSYYPIECILECCEEVTRANNDKFNGKHGPTVYDQEGKMLKPEGWVGPQLKPILEKYDVPTDIAQDSFKTLPEATDA